MAKSKLIMIAIVCVVPLVAVGAVLFNGGTSKPRVSPDADAITLAKFLTTSEYKNLSLHNRKPYAKAMREKLTQAATAFKAGTLSRQEYDAAYLNAWMARQIDRMKDYYARPSATREQSLIDQHRNKEKSTTSAPLQPEDAVEEAFVKEWTSHMKPEELVEWETFRAANKAAKQKVAGK